MLNGEAKFNKVKFMMNKAVADCAFVGDANRGLQALEDIKPGEFLMQVPLRIIININTMAKTKLAQEMTTLKIREAILGDNVKDIQMSVIAAFLLHCKKNRVQEWAPYMDYLPN
jgi:hypothetical protein